MQFQSSQANMHNCEKPRNREKPFNVISPYSNVSGDSNSVENLPVSLNSFATEIPQKRLDLDFSKLRTCGVSYRALPSNFPQSKCSGRQKCMIAKEVHLKDYFLFNFLLVVSKVIAVGLSLPLIVRCMLRFLLQCSVL